MSSPSTATKWCLSHFSPTPFELLLFCCDWVFHFIYWATFCHMAAIFAVFIFVYIFLATHSLCVCVTIFIVPNLLCCTIHEWKLSHALLWRTTSAGSCDRQIKIACFFYYVVNKMIKQILFFVYSFFLK